MGWLVMAGQLVAKLWKLEFLKMFQESFFSTVQWSIFLVCTCWNGYRYVFFGFYPRFFSSISTPDTNFIKLPLEHRNLFLDNFFSAWTTFLAPRQLIPGQSTITHEQTLSPGPLVYSSKICLKGEKEFNFCLWWQWRFVITVH